MVDTIDIIGYSLLSLLSFTCHKVTMVHLRWIIARSFARFEYFTILVFVSILIPHHNNQREPNGTMNKPLNWLPLIIIIIFFFLITVSLCPHVWMLLSSPFSVTVLTQMFWRRLAGRTRHATRNTQYYIQLNSISNEDTVLCPCCCFLLLLTSNSKTVGWITKGKALGKARSFDKSSLLIIYYSIFNIPVAIYTAWHVYSCIHSIAQLLYDNFVVLVVIRWLKCGMRPAVTHTCNGA